MSGWTTTTWKLGNKEKLEQNVPAVALKAVIEMTPATQSDALIAGSVRGSREETEVALGTAATAWNDVVTDGANATAVSAVNNGVTATEAVEITMTVPTAAKTIAETPETAGTRTATDAHQAQTASPTIVGAVE